ncbi:MAG: hypothetical protein IJT70_07140 [Clostridia bacterium]|nr:hypothetical protein [Clostridia bacterium]
MPIRIDVNGHIGIYNNINTAFDVYDEDYFNDLVREGNILYTRNNESIEELQTQRREVPKGEINDASKNSIPLRAESVNTSGKGVQYSIPMRESERYGEYAVPEMSEASVEKWSENIEKYGAIKEKRKSGGSF